MELQSSILMSAKIHIVVSPSRATTLPAHIPDGFGVDFAVHYRLVAQLVGRFQGFCKRGQFADDLRVRYRMLSSA